MLNSSCDRITKEIELKVVMPAPISGVYVRLVVWQHGGDAKWVAAQ